MFRLILPLLCCFLFSCAGLPTPSGNPEVVIPKSKRSAFASRFSNLMLDNRATITEQGQDHILYEFIGPEGLSIALTGSAIRGRVRLNFVETGDSVRVVGTRSTQERMAFGNTRESPAMFTHDKQTLQNWMNQAVQ